MCYVYAVGGGGRRSGWQWVAVGSGRWRGCLEGCCGKAMLIVLRVVRLELSKARLTHVSSRHASLGCSILGSASRVEG